MNFISQNIVYVYYHGASVKNLVGRLLYKNRKIFFEYDTSFLKKGLNLSPFKLPLQSGIIASTDPTFEGLFGVFNDSLPDGWGKLLLDRKLMGMGITPGTLSPLDRLCFVGNHGMGALSYEPETPYCEKSITTDLDQIDAEIQSILGEDDTYIDDLLVLGGSSAGARPKVLLRIDHQDWLVKFRSNFDPKDISAIEYAYHLMAKDAGLNVPEAKLFPSRKGSGFFGVKRFDRKNEQRIHMHTIAGLLHANHQEPSLDYESIMKATFYLTHDATECEAQFKNAVFNILSHSRDDHSKNFSFLMDENGAWKVSPAYDLTFSSGPSGEHSSMIMGEGKNPTKGHLLQLANSGNIKEEKALEIIDQIATSTRKWSEFAQKAGVLNFQAKHIEKVLRGIFT